MVENRYNLQRGLLKEVTNRQHDLVEEYKKITKFKHTKEMFIIGDIDEFIRHKFNKKK